MNVILIASDHAGFLLKEKLKAYLSHACNLKVKDLGPYCKERCDYPIYASALARQIALKKASRGILICKSGIGNSIVANRFPGVRAALCYSQKAARLSREHNDSNVLVLGSAFVRPEAAKRIVKTWLSAEFMGGRHRRRLALIHKTEEQICRERL